MSRLPDDTFPLDNISAELNRVFARAWSSNERERVPRSVRPHHRWGQSKPTFAAERTSNQSGAASSEEVIDSEEEDNDGSGDTIDPGDMQEYVRDELEVLATCMVNSVNDASIPGVDASQLETARLKPAELLKLLPIVQAVHMIELEFEPNQDAGMRPVLSVQVDVSEVQFLRPSTRLVLAMNSVDDEERELAVSSARQLATHVASRAWDHSYPSDLYRKRHRARHQCGSRV